MYEAWAWMLIGFGLRVLWERRERVLDRFEVWSYYIAGHDDDEPPYLALRRIHERKRD